MNLDDALAAVPSADLRQELKEAVADSYIEFVRRWTAGEGDWGRVILGGKPSERLCSGFILPRIDADGDDEASDIRISVHGLDVALLPRATGTVTVEVRCATYLRALPTSAELFADEGRLLPPAEYSAARKSEIRQRLRDMKRTRLRPDMSRSEKRAALAAIVAEIDASYGVTTPRPPPPPEVGDDEVGGAGPDAHSASSGIATRRRIPSAHSRSYGVPPAWARVEVPSIRLELPLPVEPAAWVAAEAQARATIERAVREACEAWIASPAGIERAWRRAPAPVSEDFWTPEAWDAYLTRARAVPPLPADLVPDYEVRLRIDPLPIRRPPGGHSVRIALENLRERDDEKEHGLFSVQLEVSLPADALVPMSLERVRRSYHLEGFLSLAAMGVNCGVEERAASGGRVALRTTWVPRYVLPRTAQHDVPGVEFRFASLAASAFDPTELEALPIAMLAWASGLAGPPAGGDADTTAQRVLFERDVQAWRSEAERVRLGIRLLSRSRAAWHADVSSPMAAPYRAWLLTNEAFADLYPPTPRNSAPGWRLFQLAFVLAHVPTLASRVPGFDGEEFFKPSFDEDSATLLYMSTGGGKTEAFFGTVTYGLFLDRLRGKARGVTAMMHYPLRLLTVQQAQRLARLLARAELVRRRRSVGGSAFEIGFWVGGGNTPNDTRKESGGLRQDVTCIPAVGSARGRDEAALMDGDTTIQENRDYQRAQAAWNKLPTCPFCGTPGTGLRLFPAHADRLGIVCRAASCDWNRAHPGPAGSAPLPFLLTDADIYRRAPAVLLGTIDKLALIGQDIWRIARIAGMFGLARRILGGPEGLLEVGSDEGDPLAPAWPGGATPIFDPFPSLIVQDEMHLLEESLGTFGGLFETSLFEWLREIGAMIGPLACRYRSAPDRVRLPHIIGATATASDVERHVRAIYQRRVVQFPHPGPGLHEGFYVRLARWASGGEAGTAREGVRGTPCGDERAAPWARVYASVMTNGRKHTVTTLAVLAAHSAASTRWLVDLRDPTTRVAAAEEMVAHQSDAPWRAHREAAIRSAATDSHWPALLSLVDLHRIMLTYVTNKKGGDQILSALADEVREAHRLMGPRYALDGLDGLEYATALISGGVDIATIQNVVRQAQGRIAFPEEDVPFDPEVHHPRRGLRQIVATSAVSHGVDVENFNAMAFAGLPSDVAEYIQASSRVGRTHVGFSLLVPTPQVRRDRYVVEVHEAFHRLLERMIPPPAAERWAERAIVRAVPSLIQTWLAGVYYPRLFIGAPPDAKSRVRVPDTTVEAARILDQPAAFDACADFIARAFGVDLAPSVGGALHPPHYRQVIREQLRSFRDASADAASRLREFWEDQMGDLHRPMTSLRDVEGQGVVRPATVVGRRSVDAWDIVAAVSGVRAGSTRRTPRGGELDADEVAPAPGGRRRRGGAVRDARQGGGNGAVGRRPTAAGE